MHRTFIRPTRACFLALGVAVVACGGGGGGSKAGAEGGAPGGEGAGPGPGTSAVPACSVAGDALLAAGGGASPAIAFGGGRFAVAWCDTAGGGVHLATVDDQGKQLGDQIVSMGSAPAQQASVAALPDGGFLVAWQELGAGAGGTVRARRVGADGTPRGAAFLVKATADADARPDLAANAGGAAVAWAETGSVRLGDVTGATLAHEQTIDRAGDPALTAAKNGFGLAFTSGPRLGFAALSTPIGDVTPAFFRSAPGVANVPRIAAGPDGAFALVWEDQRAGAGNEAIYMVHVGEGGQPSDEARVSSDAGSADYPDVTFVGRYAAVVYYQYRDGPPAIYMTLVGPDWQRAGDDLKVSDKGARFPRIAGGGGTLGIAYADRGGPVQVSVVACR